MSRLNLEDNEIRRPRLSAPRFEVLTHDLGNANYTLTTEHPTYLFLDAGGGAVDLILPAEADSKGLMFILINTGGETITMKDDGGSTVVAVATAKRAAVICNGTVWEEFSVVA